MRVPAGLEWWDEKPGGAEWLAALPSIVDACREQWSLELDDPFEPAHISLVVPATAPDGLSVVLKVNFPEPEGEHEPDALRHWNGEGAVRLFAYDEPRRALLIERCTPGTQLWSVDDDPEATRIGAGVLRRLWRPAPGEHRFRLLEHEARRWASELPADWADLGQPFEEQLLDAAIRACLDFGAHQGEQVVLHQDFHGGNVLRAERETWLAIDPKPLVGEREFDAASLLRDRRELLGQPDDASRIRTRLDLLAAELDLDRERMRGWGIAHALVWGISGHELEEDMVECARLLVRC
jgi:streptomycin 6-kinase